MAETLDDMKKEPLTISEQIDLLRIGRNWPAFIIGGSVGTFVPIAAFMLSGYVFPDNHDLAQAWNESLEMKVNLLMLAAAAVFSSKSVWSWGMVMFDHDWIKSLGFCVLIEGVMILSPVELLREISFGVLVFINCVGTGTGHLRKLPAKHSKGYHNAGSAAPTNRGQRRKVTKKYIVQMQEEGLSMKAIASKMRVSESTIYRHLKSK